MLPLEQFLDNVRQDIVPPSAPSQSMNGWEYLSDNKFLTYCRAREECTSRGMWAIVDMVWTRELADWIGNRKVLEIMAGRGWLAKALQEHGVRIIATDDMSWKHKHDGENLVPILSLDAVDAVKTIPADILLVSWSPYGSEVITNACREWGNERPIVYIGESEDGCNAPESFWQGFELDPTAPDIVIPQWNGLHDNLYIGHWHNT